MSEIKLIHGDCLREMNFIQPHSIDLILCDLPYGVTCNEWDTTIDLSKLWQHYKRLIKPKGSIILTATQPFTTLLINSNPDWFKYSLIWNKKSCGNFALAKFRPMMIHEDILVFSEGTNNYYPIMEKRGKPRNKRGYSKSENWNIDPIKTETLNNLYYPKSIIEISNANNASKVHPTQKPVELMEYLIKMFSSESSRILDNCMGSGSTGIACLNTNRNFIGIEKDQYYFNLAEYRIKHYKNYHESITPDYIPPMIKNYKNKYDESNFIPIPILKVLEKYYDVTEINGIYKIK